MGEGFGDSPLGSSGEADCSVSAHVKNDHAEIQVYSSTIYSFPWLINMPASYAPCSRER